MDSFGSLLKNEKNNIMIFHAWVSRRYFYEREQNPVLRGFGKILVLACISKVESRKGCEIVILLCVYDN